MTAANLVKDARHDAGITQAQLARRLGISQAAVAKLEHPASNPTVDTLDRALRATGRRLTLAAAPWKSGVDESLIRQQLQRTPAQRLRLLEDMYREAQRLMKAGRTSRGEQP
jgi:transcriptional regulator with XRE-family HTH domain